MSAVALHGYWDATTHREVAAGIYTADEIPGEVHRRLFVGPPCPPHRRTASAPATTPRASAIDNAKILAGMSRRKVGAGDTAHDADADVDLHRNAPKPTEAMLYGLAGDVGKAGAATTEASRYAIAVNFIVLVASAVGRDIYFSVGDTRHHLNLFTLHVGRTSLGRKGEAQSLPRRIRRRIEERSVPGDGPFCGQVHTGGLSTREGMIAMIHDGYSQGKEDVPAILDKRVHFHESEFANVLHQSKRDGNTLSAALRDAWDGMSIAPATKTNRMGTTDPHISISAAITPQELRGLMQSRELSNGFANRFMIFFAERERIEPFPQPTPQNVVDGLADRTGAVIRFARGNYPVIKDSREMRLSDAARILYADMYLNEFSVSRDGPVVAGVLERRAPITLRLAALFALTDMSLTIEVEHLQAAAAWSRFHRDSVRFIFNDAVGEMAVQESATAAGKILDYLKANRGQVSRRDLLTKCFSGHLSASRLDEALDSLLLDTPSKILLVEGELAENGKRPKFYKLACESGESAKLPMQQGIRPVRAIRESANLANLDSTADISTSPSSPSSQVSESAKNPAIRPSSQTRQVRTSDSQCPF